VPDRRSIFRLPALAGFLLTVALALWLAELRPFLVVLVMAAALLVAWTVEWLSWRQDVLRLAGEAVDVRDGEAALPLVPPAPVRSDPEPVVEPVAPAPPTRPAAEQPTPVTPEPELPTPVQQASALEPEPEPEPEPVSSPPRADLRPVPAPPPPPAPRRGEPPRPVRAAAAAPGVVDLRTRVTAQPRRWNLWDLERRARDEAQRDPLRYEEWSYLFVHLRQFATPDGSLPTEFDGLVRESFGELLEHAG
jgi:hypothetical protein